MLKLINNIYNVLDQYIIEQEKNDQYLYDGNYYEWYYTFANEVQPNNILEIGSGSGYQAAILSEIVGSKGRVVTIERHHELSEFAKKNLEGRKNVILIEGDGTLGCQEYAPYDRIIVTAEAPDVPKSLLDQLSDKGLLVIPIGNEMFLIEKKGNKIRKKSLGYFAFVPLVGKHGYKEIF